MQVNFLYRTWEHILYIHGNRAAGIIKNKSFDVPEKPLARRLGWKTIEELIVHESELVVFKSLQGLAPQYIGVPVYFAQPPQYCQGATRVPEEII